MEDKTHDSISNPSTVVGGQDITTVPVVGAVVVSALNPTDPDELMDELMGDFDMGEFDDAPVRSSSFDSRPPSLSLDKDGKIDHLTNVDFEKFQEEAEVREARAKRQQHWEAKRQ